MRHLLAKQERLAASSDQIAPQREACPDDPKPGRTTNLGIEPVQWRRPATVVPARPSTFLIIAVLACAGMLSLAVALLALR